VTASARAVPETHASRVRRGPLPLVAVVGLWRGLRRRSPVAFAVGVGATAAGTAAAEFTWPGYKRAKRHFSLIAHFPDD